MAEYVVLSDLHMGEEKEYAALTDPEVVEKLAKELEETCKDLQGIILTGDIIDMALAPVPECFTCLSTFLKTMSSISKSIFYVPGNHDHHIWEMCVTQDMCKTLTNGSIPGYPPAHGNYSGNQLFLTGLMPLYKDLKVIYPACELEFGRQILLTHGHLLAGASIGLLGLQEAISTFKGEERLNQLELQNSGINELLWYYLESSEIMRAAVEKSWDEGGGTFAVITIICKLLGLGKISSFILQAFKGKRLQHRGLRIGDLIPAIEAFLEVLEVPPSCFIFGHTHVPEVVRVNISGKSCVVANPGSWLASDKRGYNTYLVIDSQSVTLKKLGKGLMQRIYFD